MSKKDYYKILGVSKDASTDEIRKAYRKLAHQHHPDKGGEETKFKEINEAYQTLSNPEKRSQYDRFGASFDQAGFDFSGFNFDQNTFWQSQRAPSDSFGDLGNIFEDFFGFKTNIKPKGDNISLDLEINFEEAAFGIQKEVKLYKYVTCQVCQSRGAPADADLEICQRCGGSGQIHKNQRILFGILSQVTTCPECQGEGKTARNKCQACRGAGRIKNSTIMVVKVPAGINNGEVIKFDGLGEAAPKRGRAGDLYVKIHVKPHKYFIRKGNDIFYELLLSYTQAVLGDKLEIPTLEGTVVMEIPSGVESGKKIRLKNKGIQYLDHSGRGDMYVTIKIETPKKLTSKQKKIIEDLREEGL